MFGCILFLLLLLIYGLFGGEGGGGGEGTESPYNITFTSLQRVLSSFTFMDRIFLPVKQLYINNKLWSAEM